MLFSYNPNDKQIYLIGVLKNVKQLNPLNIDDIKNQLNQDEWLNIVSKCFLNINDDGLGFEKYKKCYHSDDIVASSENSFVLNISYEKYEILNSPINLTELFPESNKKMKKLSVLYNTTDEMSDYVLKLSNTRL